MKGKKEKNGGERLYDLKINNIHNFIANNIIVHNCLTPDTEITERWGSTKKIKDIEEGDEVKTLKGIAFVEGKTSAGKKKIIELEVGDKKLKVSKDHPLLAVRHVRDKDYLTHLEKWGEATTVPLQLPLEWRPAKVCKVGSLVVTEKGSDGFQFEEVTSFKSTHKKKEVFDIKLSKDYNFIANGVVVHNSDGTEKRKRKDLKM